LIIIIYGGSYWLAVTIILYCIIKFSAYFCQNKLCIKKQNKKPKKEEEALYALMVEFVLLFIITNNGPQCAVSCHVRIFIQDV